MTITPNSWGSPLVEFNKCHDAKGKFCSTGGLSDETGGTEPPAVGQPFIVYRLGRGASGLVNKNGGNAEGVAEHLVRMQDDEGPVPASGFGDTITAYRVVVRKPFTSYRGYVDSSGGLFALDHDPSSVGRGVQGDIVIAYSFPAGGGWSAEPIASVPVKDVQRAMGSKSFNYAGTRAGARAIRKVFTPLVKAFTRKSKKRRRA